MTPAVSLSRRLFALIVLVVVIGVAIVAFWPRAGAAPSGHTHGTIIEPGLSTLVADGIPLDPPTVEGGVGNAPETSLAAAGAAGPAGRDAGALGAERDDVHPDDVLASGSDGLGGCLAAYGTAGQCLTAIPPSQGAHVQAMVEAGIDPSTMPHDWTCAELRAYFPGGIAVRDPGVDPARLDTDGDGVACGSTD